MLTELLPKKYSFNIGESVISMRYTLAALLSLEQQGLSYEQIFDDKLTAREILRFFKAGLCEDFDDEYVEKVAREIGYGDPDERIYEDISGN